MVQENKPYIQFLVDELEAHRPKRPSIVFSANGTKSAKSVACTPTSDPVPNVVMTDTSRKSRDQVIEEILRSGKITKDLFLGELDGNSSFLDLKLCHKLVAFSDRDALLMDAVFRASRHFEKHDRYKKRDKLSRKTGVTYGQHTIKKALDANKWNAIARPKLRREKLAFP
jgi:hypothetical protein